MKNIRDKSIFNKDLSSLNIEVDHSPKKIDNILHTKYKYGLYNFAYCLNDILFNEYQLIDSKILPVELIVSNNFFDDLIYQLKNITNDTLNNLIQIKSRINDLRSPSKEFKLLNSSLFSPNDKTENKISTTKIKPESYEKEIDELIAYLKLKKESVRKYERGGVLRPRNLIFFIWSNIIKKPDTKLTDWLEIADLSSWFYWNLEGTEYANRILPRKRKLEAGIETFDAQSIRRQVSQINLLLTKNVPFKKRINMLRNFYFPPDFESELVKIQIDFTKDIRKSAVSYFEKMSSNPQLKKRPTIIFPNTKLLL
ncbi:hypothetical protein ACFLRX_08215 [Acidobacteriota bacterium]